MAAVYAPEAEHLLPHSGISGDFHRLLTRGTQGRKRSRGVDPSEKSERSCCSGQGCEVCLASSRACHSGSLPERGWEMSHGLDLQGMERTLSFEVATLRAAASAAVAECTGPLGLSLQLTAGSDQDPKSLLAKPDLAATSSQTSEPSTVAGFKRGTNHGTQAGSEKETKRKESSGVPQGTLEEGDLHSVARALVQGSDFSVYTQHGCPPHGAKAICGRRPRMEDAYTAVPFLLEVPVPADLSPAADILPPRIATQVRSASTSPNSSDGEGGHTLAAVPEKEAAEQRVHSGLEASTSRDAKEEPAPYMETLHFFGVFDGHGGAEAALHCAQTLHQRIAEALAAATDPSSTLDEDMPEEEGAPQDPPDTAGVPAGLPERVQRASIAEEPEGSTALASSSDEELMDFEEPSEGRVEGVTCTSASFESALTSAFNRTDEEFGKADNAALVGTTAVVTLVGSRQLYVANCGDSRAVLCRAGLAIPLTDDHKAAREDETARVEAAGGQILFWNGVRVMGVLAVSRAIGDHCLRPYVIAQPEVTILGRRQDDELLLLASDGLWDVLSNQEACTLAKRCLRRARQRGASRQSAARIAATVLTRAAVDRGSRDNVTVLVVDLSSGAADQEAITRTPSAALADDVTDHLHDQDPEENLARAQSRSLGAHR